MENLKKEQIEEMAVEFAKINCNPKGCYGCNLCDEYGSLELNCEDYLSYRTMAETFYNAGYRKQKEGEWKLKDGFLVCSECESTKPIAFHTPLKITYYKCDFCNKCGAKMKGGAE